MTAYELTLRLAAALVVGTVIGIERQWRHKLAGLRTNVLVAVGAATFCLIAAMSDHEASPTRIAAQVVSGIGFLSVAWQCTADPNQTPDLLPLMPVGRP